MPVTRSSRRRPPTRFRHARHITRRHGDIVTNHRGAVDRCDAAPDQGHRAPPTDTAGANGPGERSANRACRIRSSGVRGATHNPRRRPLLPGGAVPVSIASPFTMVADTFRIRGTERPPGVPSPRTPQRCATPDHPHKRGYRWSCRATPGKLNRDRATHGRLPSHRRRSAASAYRTTSAIWHPPGLGRRAGHRLRPADDAAVARTCRMWFRPRVLPGTAPHCRTPNTARSRRMSRAGQCRSGQYEAAHEGLA